MWRENFKYRGQYLGLLFICSSNGEVLNVQHTVPLRVALWYRVQMIVCTSLFTSTHQMASFIN